MEACEGPELILVYGIAPEGSDNSVSRVVMSRTFQEECSFLEQVSNCSFRIKKGFVPNMNVSARRW